MRKGTISPAKGKKKAGISERGLKTAKKLRKPSRSNGMLPKKKRSKSHQY
jgi:hypothetical protein